jgi:hypothetical protein
VTCAARSGLINLQFAKGRAKGTGPASGAATKQEYQKENWIRFNVLHIGRVKVPYCSMIEWDDRDNEYEKYPNVRTADG